ncbi:heme exporter protein CcmB [Pseudomonadales bacterium]|nr:heme exporter protein CcmB [Pseudomonadales bacterium]MDA7771414.1 heme exporter protein CcmB [Pseudomonadales bacterium]
MRAINIVMKRELDSYFSTHLAYVFILIFLVLSGVFTFYLGSFYERGQADLLPFFNFHPWLYLFLVPALSMRLWAEELKSGSIELLLTLPVTIVDAVVGKFLAAWIFAGISLMMTFPLWLTVNYLGDPDNGVIFTSYIGSWLMAGSFLAIGSCMSALSKSQVIAFILCGVVCLLFVLAGYPLVLNSIKTWVPLVVVDSVASLSFLNHFNSISRGIISLRDVLYFCSVQVVWLAATVVVINARQSR